jgi:hypothetical protein
MLLIAYLLLLASCDVDYYAGLDGSQSSPVEISTSVHRGIVGHGYRLSTSYYTFVSPSAHPTIHYDNRSPFDDLDCYVYLDPDYKDRIAQNTLISVGETTCEVSLYDCTDTRLYIKIYNYEDENDVEYDIYYTP